MSEEKKIEFIDNPDFNRWLEENYTVEIEEFEYPSSNVLYKMNYADYLEALRRYNADPRVSLSRIENSFPLPIAYYFYQAVHNSQNEHHQLDLLKSCWESIIFFIYGLVVAEARHRRLPLKAIGIIFGKYWSNRLFDKLIIVENIIDYTIKNGIPFGCSGLIPLATLADIKKLNQERNGFEHSAAKTSAQQQTLYKELYPQLTNILKQLIKLEEVLVFRYHSAESTLYPRCEIFNGCSLGGRKEIVPIRKENYMEIIDYFNAQSIFAKVNDEVFCLSPFIHYCQEPHETNAMICFYKDDRGSGKYWYEIVSKAREIEFEKTVFDLMERQLRALLI